MTEERAPLQWPSAAPPEAEEAWRWDLSHVSQLPAVRAQLRRGLAAASSVDPKGAELDEAVVLAFDEMASNALRHGGGGVTAQVKRTDRAWLVEVCDQASAQPPQPAVGRDPSLGGLGLYLIAEMADAHGWHSDDAAKSVWALLPRR
ncbi:Histidine kinase-like ATPase domain-containing protein [Modestobacter sp. DSM 44400]|uniref:ATP-binding protein n=1 Tax=Modestobacter sp. DSM 44400 TaxID=1550230 RepID=UPI000898F301|nr:ATP-binding protein [Modestobacter sp. DSM 44400]SDY18760.1 Histidine kinase-like ATPase domain-containing protein [Modestobacter sp. DSM 44400]